MNATEFYFDIKTEFEKRGCKITFDEPMSAHTSFKIGGPADVLISLPVINLADILIDIKSKCIRGKIPFLILGKGTNMLVCDEGIRGVVLKLPDDDLIDVNITKDEGEIVCGPGCTVKNLCRIARDHSLTGMEFAYGIPGTVGGGLYMNAGAYGGEMADRIIWAEGIFGDGVCRVGLDEMELGYRSSIFMKTNSIITKACFRLEKGDFKDISAQMEEILGKRRDKQPLEFPSGGSFFKRPPGNFAGALIEKSGLKGFSVGGAQVSEKHAGFVVNTGNASCGDVMKLCEHVRKTVFYETGIMLQREVIFIDEKARVS